MKANLSFKKSFLFFIFIAFTGIVSAQEETRSPIDTLATSVKEIESKLGIFEKLKFSGYFQPQFQYADSSGAKSYAGGDFPSFSDKRFLLRRSRIKATYTNNNTQFVFQFDAGEKGFTIKEMYAKITDTKFKMFSLTLGSQNRPFGFELPYSSSSCESPERGMLSQIIFPGEYDLGAMLTVQGPKSSKWNALKLEAGLFNGTGNNASEYDKQKDIIGHLTYNKSNKSEKINFGLGVSYFNGAMRQGSKFVYNNGLVGDYNGFIVDSTSTNNGLYAKREYMGVDMQLNLDLPIGITVLRAELIQGTQPGTSSSTKTPTAQSTDTYFRNFNGAYFYFIQNIMQTKFQFVAKYDWYDPNTSVSGNQIFEKTLSLKSTKLSAADIKYSTLGLGLTYKYDQNLKLTVYYDMVKNESTLLAGYLNDVKDNVLTIRMQYKF
ncbi:MAG: porin [Bacteroidota bacterium]